MTVLYPSLCYNDICYKETALYSPYAATVLPAKSDSDAMFCL